MAKPQDIQTSTPQTVTGGQSGVIIDGSTIDPTTNLPMGTQVLGPINFDSDVVVDGNIYADFIFGTILANVSNAAHAETATVALQVSQNNQPNINQVGTLLNLNVAGDINTLGNITSQYFIGNGSQLTGINANSDFSKTANYVVQPNQPNITSLGNLTTLVVSGKVNSDLAPNNSSYSLGTTSNRWQSAYLENIYSNNQSITSNNNGFILSGNTYGSFVGDITGTSTKAIDIVGNSQPNITSVGTLSHLSVVGNISGQYILGNGYYLTGINSNGNSEYSQYANIANVANVAYSVNVANVVGLGNIATLNLDGNVSNILHGDGSWGPERQDANANYANYAGSAFSVSGGNVSGTVNSASFANIANTANSVSGSNVVGSVANANFATYSATTNNVSGSNVVGSVASALVANVANIAYSVSAANVVGNVAFANIANIALVANSVNVANVAGIGNIAIVNLTGNASQLLDGTGNFVAIPSTANSNYANFAGTAFNISGSNVNGDVRGANHANISDAANIAYSVSGSNVTSQVANALVAGTVYTNSQPNITSVGTLTGLNVNGNVGITGNLTVIGNVNYANVTDLVVGNPLIFIGSNNLGNLYDLGLVAQYDDTSLKYTGLARNHNNGTWTFFDTLTTPPTATNINWAGTTNANVILGNLTASGNISGQYIIGNGALLTNINSANIVGSTSVRFTVKNTSAGTLTKGTPIYVTGSVGASGVVEVQASRADTASTMGCVGMLEQDLTKNAFGTAISVGEITNINTNGFNLNDTIYVAPTGGVTNVRPVDGYVVQPIGTVSRVNASTGVYQVNIWDILDLPNLNNGNIWVGNASNGSPVQTPLSTANVGNATFATTAGSATTAGTVTANSQPNITSVGNLTTITVTGISNLGNVGNVIITGGANNQFLRTNGNGVLTWSTSGVPTGGNIGSVLVKASNTTFDTAWVPQSAITLYETNPVFTYNSVQQVTRIDYASGNYKLFTYNILGQLTRLDYIRGVLTIRKDFTYNPDGTLNNIVQTEF